ncbi:MAG: hypothetical protein K9L64_07240 [Candidatus Izimaplasma sp.]|nr:hypothetical protein [Candidatus Izimaplasma bacterium]
MKKEKKKKPEIIDDGRTIAEMNVKGFRWYQSKETISKKAKIKALDLTPRERRAMIIGSYLAYLPVLLGLLAAFSVAYLLFYLWAISFQ